MNSKVHFSSDSAEWETPQEVFDALNKEFHLNFDVCATRHNAKIKGAFFTKKQDGLSKNWLNLRCWMNPPYGREIGKWVKKAAMGGGRNCCGLTSRAHRHQMVSRIHLQKEGSNSSFYQRSFEVQRTRKLSAIPFYDSNLALI